jgi:hypothetical protein
MLQILQNFITKTLTDGEHGNCDSLSHKAQMSLAPGTQVPAKSDTADSSPVVGVTLECRNK